jgi:hypothetical protein
MRYALKLLVRYEFDRPSGGGRQHLRIRPAELPGMQSLLHARLRVTPHPAEERRFADFFCTEVVELVMPPGLTEVSFDLRARVERLGPGAGLDMSPPPARLAAEIAQARSLDRIRSHQCLFRGPRPYRGGHGRDYSDVAPVSGVLRLDAGQSGRHSVDIVAL